MYIYRPSYPFPFIKNFIKNSLKNYTTFDQQNPKILLVLRQSNNTHEFHE